MIKNSPLCGTPEDPDVDQGLHNGLTVSYNPDDNRFYVTLPNEVTETVATFACNQKGWQNCMQYCRSHAVPTKDTEQSQQSQ